MMNENAFCGHLAEIPRFPLDDIFLGTLDIQTIKN